VRLFGPSHPTQKNGALLPGIGCSRYADGRIKLGGPSDNGFDESRPSRFRDEFLDHPGAPRFTNLSGQKAMTDRRRFHHNHR